jgi:hypothetical protein
MKLGRSSTSFTKAKELEEAVLGQEDWMEHLREYYGLNSRGELQDEDVKKIIKIAASKDSQVWIDYAEQRKYFFPFMKALVLLTFRFNVKNSQVSAVNRKTIEWLVDLYGGMLPNDQQLKRMPFAFNLVEGEVQVRELRYHLEIIFETFSHLPSLVRCGMLVLMSSEEAANTLRSEPEKGDYIVRVSNKAPSMSAITHLTLGNAFLIPKDGSVKSYSKTVNGASFTFYEWDTESIKKFLKKLAREHKITITKNPFSEMQLEQLDRHYDCVVKEEYSSAVRKLKGTYFDGDPDSDLFD